MAIPLLPSLRADSTIAITKRGEWSANAQNTLNNLVSSLKVAANKQSSISSIPDVWARPALYELVLQNEKHPLHETYRDEWRGIIAIMALRKLRGFDDVKLVSIDIPEISKIKDSDPEFLKVAARSLPDWYAAAQKDPTIKPGYAAKIQVVVYGNVPLAMTWPTILLCPSLNLAQNRQRDVSWWKVDGINNPIPELSDDEKNALVTWLQNIINQTVNNDLLMSLLTSYRDDLKESLGDSYQDDYKINSKAGSSLGITGTAQLLDNPVVGTTDDSFLKKSNVLLMRRKHGKEKDLILLSRDIEKQWNMNASDIIVGGYVTASSAVPRATGMILDHTKLGDIDLNDFNAEVHMIDEFFTDKLAVIHLEINAFPNSLNNKLLDYNGTKVNAILPLKKELLDYFDSEFLAKHISLTVVEGGIEAVLELPVSGMDNKGKFLIAKKLYRSDYDSNDFIEYDTVPLLQVWPNFILSEADLWKRYFTYYDGEGVDTFYAVPAWNMEDREAVRYIHRDYCANRDAEICRGKHFPEAFCCTAQTELASGEEETIEIGLILLKKPETKIISTTNKPCRIGIDFGTTNTIAYMSVGGEAPKPITFPNRMYYVTHNELPEKGGLVPMSKRRLRQNFMSATEQPNGSAFIKTMFHSHYGAFDGDLKKIFFRGNIYYLDDASNISQDKSILDNIHTDDMKWGDATSAEYMQSFLTQLCVQCLAEAIEVGASQIEWKYSYPTAFSPQKQNQYQRMWKTSVMKEIREISSIDCLEPTSQTESDSVAEYVIKGMGGAMKRGIVCLDIGGGSTDIAIWQGNQSNIQKQASVRFAGRDILNAYLWQKRLQGCQILSQFKESEAKFNKAVDKLMEVQSEHEFNLQLEALLKYDGDKIFESLPNKCYVTEVKTMIRDISFALAGIFFYTGMIVGYLRRSGTYQQKELLPVCYVGGNASRLLDWAAAGQFTTDEMISKVFKACFMAGLDIAEPDAAYRKNFRIERTELPKQEVAYGLVCGRNSSNLDDDDDFDDDFEESDASVIAGEQFTIENTGETGSEILTAADVLDIVQVDQVCPPNFAMFMQTFNKWMKKLGYDTIHLSEDDFINICSQVNDVFAARGSEADGDEDQVELEPVFITELKEAFAYISKQ